MNDETKARYAAWKKSVDTSDPGTRTCSSSSPRSSASSPSRPISSCRSGSSASLLLPTRFARAGRRLAFASLIAAGDSRPVADRQCADPSAGGSLSALGRRGRGARPASSCSAARSRRDVSAARNEVALNEAAERLTVVGRAGAALSQCPHRVFGRQRRADLRRGHRGRIRRARCSRASAFRASRVTARGSLAQHARERDLLQGPRPARSRASAGCW